jgi:membrane protein
VASPTAASRVETTGATPVPAEPRKQLGWIIRKVIRQMREDDCVDLAAQMSFFFVFSVFDFFVVLLAVAGFLPDSRFWLRIFNWVVGYLPAEVNQLFLNMIAGIPQHEGLLSIGFLTALWAATSGVVTLMETLTHVYELPEHRSFWRKRWIALQFLLFIVVVVIVTFGSLALGHDLAARIYMSWGLGATFQAICRLVRWLFVGAILGVGVTVLDNVLPNRRPTATARRAWRGPTPAGIVTTITLAVETSAINFYVVHVGRYNQLYGAVSAFFVMMIWIYVASFVILAGAEIDCVVAKARLLSAAPAKTVPAP